MQQGLSLRVSQQLALTPQLQQAIRLLQLSTQELDQEVEQMLADNPFLERQTPDAEREAFGLPQADTPLNDFDQAIEASSYSTVPSDGVNSKTSTDTDQATSLLDDSPSWDGDGSSSAGFDDAEWGSEAGARGNSVHAEDDYDAAEMASNQESLTDFLQRQVLGLRLGAEDAAALAFLIGSLNDDGYLEEPLDELACNLAGDTNVAQQEQLLHHLKVALGLLQSLEPSGVGARDLAECLCLQLRALDGNADFDAETVKLALAVCAQPISLLAKRDTKRLALLCQASETALRQAINLIGQLEPKPARRFVNLAHNIVVPDVLVSKSSNQSGTSFVVRLNPDVVPQLRVHDIYANALKGYQPGANQAANSAALHKRLQEARWFIKNVRQRFDTILRVSRAIVERQRNFFVHGALAMRPLVLREVADELGLHESTISRVTNAKYMATPQGTFELKYFFGSGLGTESGGNASSTAVRALLKQFIAGENTRQPLSDSQLSTMLKDQGIECARRTVAKYREALRIAPASLRKTMPP